ncbi:MAG: hypothetical protein QOF14_3699 [Hyphomicrobiales bacterium]|jgi:hypothetical protein|nr:hypothetical protein [Hyphomicrobiales bacterium]
MDEGISELLDRLLNAPSLADVWQAARRLMSDKRRSSATADPRLVEGLRRLGGWAATGSGAERLIAIDLLVRIPASIRKLERTALPFRAEALRTPIPPLSIIAEKKNLPEGAEPAEIRENVAKALTDAEGEWVFSYAVQAFAEEDRSQRCRLALAAQIARRSPNIDDWLTGILQERSLRSLSETSNIDNAAARLRDIALALSDAIRRQRYRLQLSVRAGQLLSELAGTLVPLGPRDPLPKRLGDTAGAIIQLLDEFLAVRLTLMDEPEIYEVLERLRRWWSPARYPAKVTEALTPIVDKIVAGIVFRARGGQRSESLLQRLRQAINDEKEISRRLTALASNETGLSPDVQDWLLRIERKPSHGTEGSRLLAAVGEESFIRALAPAFLQATESVSSANNSVAGPLADMVISLGSQFGLTVIGKPGDEVEYSPSTHDSVQGAPPRERRVSVVRPPVLRRRADGGSDVIMKGLVKTI